MNETALTPRATYREDKKCVQCKKPLRAGFLVFPPTARTPISVCVASEFALTFYISESDQ